MIVNYFANLSYFVPELVIIGTMVSLLFLEATYKNEETGRKIAFSLAGIGLIITFFALLSNLSDESIAIFTNAVVIDKFSTFSKIIMVLGTLGAVYLSSQSKEIYDEFKGEFVIMSLGVLVGGMLLSSANNMLTLYLGVETLSILSYVLASLRKNDDRSSEAGLKYSLYGGIAAGLMLFGMSHIYGVMGTIQFEEIMPKLKALSSLELSILVPSFLLFFVGIGYKIACVPFHMWAPDVYEGSPIPVTTFFSIVPKVAGITALVRVTMVFFSQKGALQDSWISVLQVVSVLTMFVGNISAINQKSVKRMLAYSSIAHAGFMLLGVVVMDEVGARSILFYSAIYLFMTLSAFYMTSFIADKYGNDHFERFNGLYARYPIMAIMMCVAMFSLSGLPPFGGFVAKFNILKATIDKGYYTLATIGALNSVISLYYYLKVVRFMVFQPAESEDKIEGFSFKNQAIIVGITSPIIILGLFWGGLMLMSTNAKILILQ
jgi:NADH-quinone oxidoreductase subunit N